MALLRYPLPDKRSGPPSASTGMCEESSGQVWIVEAQYRHQPEDYLLFWREAIEQFRAIKGEHRQTFKPFLERGSLKPDKVRIIFGDSKAIEAACLTVQARFVYAAPITDWQEPLWPEMLNIDQITIIR